MIMSFENSFMYSTSVSETVTSSVRCPSVGVKYLLNFSAIETNPLNIGTSRGTSSTLPISGYRLGPGGYGGLVPLRRHFKARAKHKAAHIEAPYSKALSLILRADSPVGLLSEAALFPT